MTQGEAAVLWCFLDYLCVCVCVCHFQFHITQDEACSVVMFY